MRRLAVLGAVLVFAFPAYADRPLDDPAGWLTRISESARQVDYHGDAVYRHGDRVETMEIARRGAPAGYFERLLMLDGVPREVMRDGESVTCILPDGRASLAGQRVPRNPFPGDGWEYTDAVAEHYDFVDLGDARVAGRSCKVIGVEPRDGYRYGYRLWVDHETGLLLRSDIVDGDEVVEQVAFTRVRLPGALDAAVLEPTLDGDRIRWTVRADTGGDETMWSIDRLPAGFAETGMRERGSGAIQHILSDGLATVSVFVAPADDGRPGLSGTSRMGAVNAFGTVIDGFQVTVVGEVPAATVQAIGESLKLGER